MRPILETPDQLVTDGRFNLGTFKAPFSKVNPLDARLAVPLPRAVKNLRLKEWQHFALVIRSKYRGPFGAFSGRLRPEDSEDVVVDGFFGMCENFYLRT